jgi:putative phosphoribosyl transferase
VIAAIAAKEEEEIARQEHLYRLDRPPPDVRGKTVILVDDGLATGATMGAAVQALRQQHAARIVVAVPVASPETCQEFSVIVEDIICAVMPVPFQSVGLWYDDFTQTTDDMVRFLLARRMQEYQDA